MICGYTGLGKELIVADSTSCASAAWMVIPSTRRSRIGMHMLARHNITISTQFEQATRALLRLGWMSSGTYL